MITWPTKIGRPKVKSIQLFFFKSKMKSMLWSPSQLWLASYESDIYVIFSTSVFLQKKNNMKSMIWYLASWARFARLWSSLKSRIGAQERLSTYKMYYWKHLNIILCCKYFLYDLVNVFCFVFLYTLLFELTNSTTLFCSCHRLLQSIWSGWVSQRDLVIKCLIHELPNRIWYILWMSQRDLVVDKML